MAVAGTLIGILSILLNSALSWKYIMLIGLIYGLALGIAFKIKGRITSVLYIFLYAFFTQVIYLLLLGILVAIIRPTPVSDEIQDEKLLAIILSGISAVCTLFLTKVILGLHFNKILYFVFFAIAILIPIVALDYAVIIWQIAFALGLNEILKRQEQDSLKTNSQKANSF
ncbi:MAG TPA: hypothetical protein VEC36_01220 [Patescibacteria group bacterium]|nr:hypothetical protein [Patescibacteria group bacterium]